MNLIGKLRAEGRDLFLKWVLLNVLALVFLTVGGLAYAHRIHGPSLVVVPLMLVVYSYAAAYAGRICWRAGDHDRSAWKLQRLLHEAEYLNFWVWLLQMMGMLTTVYGFWLLLTSGGTDQNLHDRILSGGGVALVGTWVGIFTSVILAASHRMIEHDLEG